MKSRLAASLALVAVALTGATGCTFITPQSTTIDYSASDGVNVSETGPVVVRNAMIIVNNSGTAGNFVGALINTSTRYQTMTIHVEGLMPLRVTLAAGELLSFGSDSRAPLALPGFSGKPGTTVQVSFQSGQELGTVAAVPVLDGRLPHYRDLAPSDMGVRSNG